MDSVICLFSIQCFCWFYFCWRLFHKGYSLLPKGNFVLLLSRDKGKFVVHVCIVTGNEEQTTKGARRAFWDKVQAHHTVLDVQTNAEDQNGLMQHSLPRENFSFRPLDLEFLVLWSLRVHSPFPLILALADSPPKIYQWLKPPWECWRPWVYNLSLWGELRCLAEGIWVSQLPQPTHRNDAMGKRCPSTFVALRATSERGTGVALAWVSG